MIVFLNIWILKSTDFHNKFYNISSFNAAEIDD